jgi:hypothetical protein
MMVDQRFMAGGDSSAVYFRIMVIYVVIHRGKTCNISFGSDFVKCEITIWRNYGDFVQPSYVGNKYRGITHDDYTAI